MFHFVLISGSQDGGGAGATRGALAVVGGPPSGAPLPGRAHSRVLPAREPGKEAGGLSAAREDGGDPLQGEPGLAQQ